ncbi:MAG: tetratricopeptide repeat protein [Gammaproteobacteria bacterium]
MRSFFRQLRDRKVFRAGIVYLAAAWLVMQVADVVMPALHLPDWSLTLIVVALIIGFPVALVLAWAFELTPDGLRPDPAGARPDAADSDGDAAPARAGRDGTPSVAILPFLDLSADRDNEYFVDGLTEELLTCLAEVQGLRVASRTSCFAFKNQHADLDTVADRLGVSHVIEGSVRKHEDQLRIAVKLVQVDADSPVWSSTYDRKLDDVFAIQRDIATHVVGALRGRLRPRELAEATTSDPKAYEYYLRGRGYLMTHGTRQMEFARQMFTRAVEIDPEFARGWSGLAAASAALAIYHGGGDEAAETSSRASSRAVELAPDRADSHAVRGLALLASGEFEAAGAAFEKALSINPGHFEALYYYARACVHEGKTEKALELFERGAAVNPDDYECPLLASSLYSRLGEAEASREAARRGLENARRHLEDYPDNHRAYDMGACALIKLGDSDQAMVWAEKARALSPADVGTRYNAACVYAQAGEIDMAFECLEGLPIPRSWVENDSDLDALRDDPRFANVGRPDG